MPILRYARYPEWAALLANQIAEDTLTKTRVYNAAADTYRLLRPEDMGLDEGTYCFSIAPGANSVISFRVPAGQGISFYGFWVKCDLGCGSYIQLKVNNVKRQEVPARFVYNLQEDFILLFDQVVFVSENDLVEIVVYNAQTSTVSCDFFPLAIIAGKAKQLLVTT